MSTLTTLRALARGAVVILMATTPLWAQGGLSTYITGVITDPSGGSIAGAQITITNEQTGITTEFTSNEVGLYRSAALSPGRYRVDVSQAGFSKMIRQVVLEVGQALRLDFALQLGEVTQTIEVKEATPVLNTENAELG